MKLVTFQLGPDSDDRLGALVDEGVLPLEPVARQLNLSAVHATTSMLSLLKGGEAAMDLARRCVQDAHRADTPPVPMEEITLRAPVPRPESIRDCMAFEQHLLQATRGAARLLYPPVGRLDGWLARVFGRGFLSVPQLFHEIPAYYKGNPASVVGPGAAVRWPSYSNKLDYELEFGVFIGVGGVNIPAARAMEHVAGFTIFNDFSARDTQLTEMKLRLGPAKGKDFDTGNAMGPWLVTPDELGDPYALRMTARVGTELWTDATSGGMAFSFEEIIAYISRSETLHPGDFIAGGTVGGGCGLEHGRWLSLGDTIELSVDGLGTLVNTVVAEGA